MVVPTRTRALLATPRKASTSSPLRARIAKPPNKRRRLLEESSAQLGAGYDVLNAKAGEQAVNGNPRKGRKPKQSPRKRKRAPSVEEESDTGSWVPAGSASGSNTSEDEGDGGNEEMQFIDEDDRHLLREASSAHLQRLRKQELARLWRVAGLDTADTSEGDDNDELRKSELVEGIIKARRPSTPNVRLISPLPKNKHGQYRSREQSTASTYQISNPSSRSSTSADSQSSLSAAARNRRSSRRASTLSSAPSSDRPRRKSFPVFPRGTTPSRRAAAAAAAVADDDDDDVNMDQDPTPIQKRLRPRARAPGSEADAEDDDHDASPVRKSERSLPGRRAKRAAIEALKGGESTGEESETQLDITSPESEKSQPPRRRSRSHRVLISPPVSDEGHGSSSSGEHVDLEDGDDADADTGRHLDIDEDESVDGDLDIDLSEATKASLYRLLRHQLVTLCELRGLEVGGTKAQLAQALLDWRDENGLRETSSSPSSTGTAKPVTARPGKIIHAINNGGFATNAKPTPVLLRDHVHAEDPVTPPHSEEPRSGSRNEQGLDLDLSGLGLEDSMIDQSQLVKLEKIGSGGFKDVFVGKLKGRKVAISEFRGHLSEMDIRELKLLSDFAHENIVRFRGVCIPSDSSQIPCMLVSELCENGDLFDYIRNVPRPSIKRVLNLMLDIAKGLEYLHTRKPAVIHRDCKSSNILINKYGKAKVGDFGLARVKHTTRSMIRSLVGTVNWQAPELWHANPRYDYKVDVFSCGMVYWEMLSGWTGEKKYPWEGHNEHYIYDAVGAKHKRPSVANLRKQWGAEPVNLVERMWAQDPAQRPTMTDVVHDLEALIADL